MPNQLFIDFTMEGMLQTINNLHDQCNEMIRFLLYQSALNTAKFSKAISERQFNTIMVMMTLSDFYSPAELLRTAPIKALYSNLVQRTFYRDIESLVNKGYLFEEDGKLKLTI